MLELASLGSGLDLMFEKHCFRDFKSIHCPHKHIHSVCGGVAITHCIHASVGISAEAELRKRAVQSFSD